jgi:peptidoglycan/xylan/chitin deacetylase (PgdA/CDA1 family)
MNEKLLSTLILPKQRAKGEKTSMNRNGSKTSMIMLTLFFIFSFWKIAVGQCQTLQTKEKIVSAFAGKVPKEWGQTVKGVKTKLNTDQKVIALTFDACGGIKGSGYDAKLIDYLENEKIPASLFISGRWIDANRNIFQKLANNPLFDIENHGLNHKPCSVNGRSVYGIEGTRSVSELIDEIEQNGIEIHNLTGRKPRFYRPGTTFCDEVGVEVAHALGYEVVNFNVLGDAGATYSKEEVKEALWNAPPSSIVLMHMNHPEGETAQGVIEALPELRRRGFKFVKLSEYGLR